MDFFNLKNNYPQLLSYLEDNSYSSSYISRMKAGIEWILEHDNEPWTSYCDVLEARIAACSSQSPIVHKVIKAIISAIYRFDLYDELPSRSRNSKHKLLPIFATDKLNPCYRSIIDRFIEAARIHGLKASTVDTIRENTACFLLSMQDKGKTSLEMISEDDLLEYTLTGNNGGRFCADTPRFVRYFFAILKNEPECARLAVLVPRIKQKRKNQPILTDEEVTKIRRGLDREDLGITLRDRSMVIMLLRLWLRRADVANLRFSDIDWKQERITLRTEKTGEIFDAVVPVEVLNTIYRYITEERPQCSEEEFVFVTKVPPYNHVSTKAPYHAVTRVFAAIGIRQEPGAHLGTHQFRRYGATAALKEGIPRPLISSALAHASPSSITPYLRADFAHLKACALSIETFPVAEEVFHE